VRHASAIAADGAGGLRAEEVDALGYRHADDSKAVVVTEASHLEVLPVEVEAGVGIEV